MNFIFDLLSPIFYVSASLSSSAIVANKIGGDYILKIIVAVTAIILGIVFVCIIVNKRKNINQNKNNIIESDKIEHQKSEEQIKQMNSTAQQIPSNQQVYTEQPALQKSHSFLIFLFKLLILGGIIFFTLWNYRLFEINKGWSITEISNKSSYSQVSDFITDGIEKIEYFKVPHSCNDDSYKIHISTSTKSYLFDATEDDIKILNTLGVLSSNVKPHSVTVIPFYVEIIVGLIVIFIPIGRRR